MIIFKIRCSGEGGASDDWRATREVRPPPSSRRCSMILYRTVVKEANARIPINIMSYIYYINSIVNVTLQFITIFHATLGAVCVD